MDYLTNDTELTAVADAIREKCETTDLLEWPDGFIQAIEDCQTDGPELEWLWGNQITNTLSGTVDSTDDAYAAPILNLGVDGVSTQVTMTGKNLLPNNRFCRSYYNPAEGTTFDSSAAAVGTVTDNGDGTFTMTAPSGWTGATLYSEVLPAGEYYLKASFSGSTVRVSIGYIDASTMTMVGTAYNLTASGAVTRHWTFESSVIVYVSISSSSAGTVTITQPQLEVGSTATTYEPYTGGKPSPSPDYPQDILSVEPRNILPSTVYQLAENITVVANSAYRSMYCEVDPNTTYTVSRARVLGNRFGVYTTTVEPAAGVALTLIKSPTENTYILSYTFTTPADAAYAFFYLANNGADVSDSEMQLENGSVAHPYLPYGCSLGLVLAGKNLWADLSPGYININGGVTSPSSTMLEYVTDYIPATYGDVIRIVNLMPTDAAPWIGIGTYDSSKTFIIRYGRTDRNWDWTIPEANTAYIRISMRTYGYHSHIVATQNETPTTIPLYDGTLRSLPDGTKDELHLSYLKPSNREGWAWYKAKLVQMVKLLDLGSINWVKDSNSAWNTFYSSFAGLIDSSDFNTQMMCSAFTWTSYHTPANMPDNSFAMTNSAALPLLRIRCSTYYDQYTAAQFKTALSGVMMLYPLATPIVTELDPIELPIMPSENATVWCDGGSAQPTFMLEYIQNANIVISRLEDSIADLATS